MLTVIIRARQMLVANLPHRRNRGFLFRIPSPTSGWRELSEFYCPTTKEARLGLLKHNHVKTSLHDDPIQRLIEMQEVAKQLESDDQSITLTEKQASLNGVWPSTGYKLHKRALHDQKSPLTRKIAVG